MRTIPTDAREASDKQFPSTPRNMVRNECTPYDAGAAQSIGIAAVLVQAKDEAARAWYLAQAEWMEFPAGSRTLWLPVGVVSAVC